MRFLFVWQHAHPDHQLEGPLGLVAVLEQLQGSHLPAAAWEWQVLQARLRRYDPAWLDHLCLSGELAWGRLLRHPTPKDARVASSARPCDPDVSGEAVLLCPCPR